MLTGRRGCWRLLGLLGLLLCGAGSLVGARSDPQRRASGHGGGPAGAAAAAAGSARAGFPLSSFTCSSERNIKARVCFLENIFIYQGQVWFVAGGLLSGPRPV